MKDGLNPNCNNDILTSKGRTRKIFEGGGLLYKKKFFGGI